MCIVYGQDHSCYTYWRTCWKTLSFGVSDFVSEYHSQVLVCPLQEVQFADEDYELLAQSVTNIRICSSLGNCFVL